MYELQKKFLLLMTITFVGAIARTNISPTQNSPVILYNVECTGSEQRLFDCRSQILEVSSCSLPAYVFCAPGKD